MHFRKLLFLWILVFSFQGSTVFAHEVLLILDPGHGGSDHGGWSGDGFKFGNGYVAEDAYTFDVAKRVEAKAKEKGWVVAFTVRDKLVSDHVADSDEYNILPPRRNLIFNLPLPYEIVHRGRDGLGKRLSVTRRLNREYRGAIQIFVSLHIDLTEPYVQGMHIFTGGIKNSNEFAESIIREAREQGLGFRVRSEEKPMINEKAHLYVLRRGVITPRVLIELGNFYNPRDQLLILRSEGREKYAEVIANAIEDYVK